MSKIAELKIQIELVTYMVTEDKKKPEDAVEFLYSTVIKKRGKEAEEYLTALCSLAEQRVRLNIIEFNELDEEEQKKIKAKIEEEEK